MLGRVEPKAVRYHESRAIYKIWSKQVIQVHSDHGISKEQMNPLSLQLRPISGFIVFFFWRTTIKVNLDH